ncbi:hypothetical protein WG66_012042 [Moniliophthora roreri]|nr:hypothetical protein WG66_012042 [Moniliophthora roreri]
MAYAWDIKPLAQLFCSAVALLRFATTFDSSLSVLVLGYAVGFDLALKTCIGSLDSRVGTLSIYMKKAARKDPDLQLGQQDHHAEERYISSFPMVMYVVA